MKHIQERAYSGSDAWGMKVREAHGGAGDHSGIEAYSDTIITLMQQTAGMHPFLLQIVCLMWVWHTNVFHLILMNFISWLLFKVYKFVQIENGHPEHIMDLLHGVINKLERRKSKWNGRNP